MGNRLVLDSDPEQQVGEGITVPFKDPEVRNRYHRNWRRTHKDSVLASIRGWLVTPNGIAYQKNHNLNNRQNRPNEHKSAIKRSNDKLRLEVLTHYSGGVPECACCGESILDFLTLDHTGGGGGAARRSEGHRGGTAQYRRLRRAGFPPGYRVLCWNCNCTIGKLGKCPHQEANRGRNKRNA